MPHPDVCNPRGQRAYSFHSGVVERQRILVVEDDRALAQVIAAELDRAHVTRVVHTGEEALVLAEMERFDLIVLDLNLPDIDGLAVAERLAGSSASILMLTARADVRSRVGGLYAGADDYLAKPFEMEELLARVHAQLRRRVREEAYHCGPLTLWPSRGVCTIDGETLLLTALEFRLLELLMTEQGRVHSKDAIHDRLYEETAPTSNAVEALVSRLRTKLDAAGARHVIENLRGLGYVVRTPR
ncbi:MAG: response regulator transcription factor [Trueperaceae bacterium]|nr:response regulator transcription factor [Trueperaceae bacterium]